mmetsp:Transcript_3851/g.10862  ORF Transcript_3851/g.10862 Transcript_3851/m.10862 type:complete len:246 (+) Transcript_3851:2176-2913(+)
MSKTWHLAPSTLPKHSSLPFTISLNCSVQVSAICDRYGIISAPSSSSPSPRLRRRKPGKLEQYVHAPFVRMQQLYWMPTLELSQNAHTHGAQVPLRRRMACSNVSTLWSSPLLAATPRRAGAAAASSTSRARRVGNSSLTHSGWPLRAESSNLCSDPSLAHSMVISRICSLRSSDWVRPHSSVGGPDGTQLTMRSASVVTARKARAARAAAMMREERNDGAMMVMVRRIGLVWFGLVWSKAKVMG